MAEIGKNLSMLVCSTCGAMLNGRTCMNGHNSYPASRVEVVLKDPIVAAFSPIGGVPTEREFSDHDWETGDLERIVIAVAKAVR